MSEPTVDREARLANFSRGRDEFEQLYRTVPDDALSYIPEGEDYALGGLAVHVTDALYHYAHVLDVMKQANYGEVRAIDPVDDAKRSRDSMVAAGFPGSDRSAVFGEMRAAHDAVASRLSALPADEFGKPAPVLYGAESQEPYVTRASDVLGWVVDHYQDHIKQVAELLARWRQTR